MNKKHLTIAGIIFAIAVTAGGVWLYSQGSGQLTETKQTCSEQNGTICSSAQTCSGSWLDASDSDRCCSVECEENDDLQTNLIDQINLGNSVARPEIVVTDNRVFIVYMDTSDRSFRVKIYSKDFSSIISEKILVSPSPEYGSPTDIRIDSDEDYLYAFYELANDLEETTHLFGAKYELNDDFNLVAETGLISDSEIFYLAENGNELLDDPIVLVTEKEVIMITRYMDDYEQRSETRYKIYKFTKNLVKEEEFDLDLSSVADGHARQASIRKVDEDYYMVLPTTIGDMKPTPRTDNIVPADILMIKLDKNWMIKDSKIISAEKDVTETYVTGFDFDGEYFYIGYKYIPQPISTMTGMLKIYDKEFNLVIREEVKTISVDRNTPEIIRMSLDVQDNKIYYAVGNKVFIYQKTGEKPQTCSELGGTICLSPQTCSGSLISASDNRRCCDGTCGDSGKTPIYVTFYSHNEEGGYWESLVDDEDEYKAYRANLVEKIKLLNEYGAVLNWESDHSVLRAMQLHEKGDLLEETNGKNILKWMVDDMGMVVDPHGHLTEYNYADLAYLIEQLGVTPSSVIGGFGLYICVPASGTFDELDWRTQLEIDSNGLITGRQFPDYTWQPKILAQPAMAEHTFEEYSSGIWRPSGETFLEHDSDGQIIYVGQGYPFYVENMGAKSGDSPTTIWYNEAGYIKELASLISLGDVPTDNIYTASISIRDEPSPPFVESSLESLRQTLEALKVLSDNGQIIYLDYESVIKIWQEKYNEQASRLGIERFSIYDEMMAEATEICKNGGQGSCGDGVCDEFEQQNNVCFEDCGENQNTHPASGCGDGICDEFEQNNPHACPKDCD